jgi:ankyrin repeat protein
LIYINSLKELLEETNSDIVDINSHNDNGDTALVLASEYRHKNIVSLLLKNGADPNIRTYNDYTALYFALINQNMDIVKILLDHGANINERNCFGSSLLHKLLYAQCPTKTIKFLIKKGTYINVINKSGDTPLILASFYSDAKYAKIILESGANIKIVNNDGQTALDIATYHQNKKVVKIITNKIILVPFMNRRFKGIPKDIRESRIFL